MYSRIYPMHDAAENGNLQRLQELIAQGRDIDAADHQQVRPIHVASLKGHAAVVEALVSSGCVVNAKARGLEGELGATPLHLAARHADPRVADALIRAGANVNARNRRHCSALHLAAIFNHPEVAKSLISANVDVDAKDGESMTPLLYASVSNFVGVAEVLIKSGADVNARKDGTTPLHFACQNGNVRLVNLLLRSEANINAKNAVGLTPLHLAVRHCHWEIGHILLHSGASVLEVDSELCSPLHYAASYISPNKLTQLLIAKGAKVNAREKKGRTPLLVAMERDNSSMMSILIKNKADINIPGNDGSTPLHYAACFGNPNTVQILLSSGAQLHSMREDRRTPLHYAAAYHNAEICKLLLAKGADVNAVDNEQVTPLHLAVSLDDHSQRNLFLPRRDDKACKLGTIKLLVQNGANVNARRSFDPISHTYDVTPFHLAIKCKDLEVARCLLDLGACFDADVGSIINPISTTQLVLSCEAKNLLPLLKITRQLFVEIENQNFEGILKCISEGAPLNSGSVRYGTPLMYATWKGYIPVVHLLIREGADVNMPSSFKVTTLHYAAMLGHYSLMCSLLQRGAIFDIKTKYRQKTPVDFALECGNKNVAAGLRLIARCFEIVRKRNDHLASHFEAMAVENSVDFLLGLLNCKNTKNETLLGLAEKKGCRKISSFLKDINNV